MSAIGLARNFFRLSSFIFRDSPRYFWPSGYPWRVTSRNEDNLLDATRAIGEAIRFGSVHPDLKLECVPNLEIMEVWEISCSEAVKTVRDLGLDRWCSHPENRNFLFDGETALLKIKVHSISPSETGRPGFPYIFYIPYYHGHYEEFTAFEELDVISLVLSKDGWPVMAFNHHTNVLVNCDFWDLEIKNKEGVIMPRKGKNFVADATELIMELKYRNPPIFFLGRAVPRVQKYGRTLGEEPKVLISKFRDCHEWIIQFIQYGIAAFVIIEFLYFVHMSITGR